MKKKIFILGIICLSLNVSAQRESAIINPVNPVHYENVNGQFRILSFIKQEHIGKSVLKAEIGGQSIEVTRTNNPDSLLVWLPMIGNESRFKLMSNKTVVVDQVFTPFIPSDWGYFQNGTIHLIQSSHQDIAWMNTPDSCRMDRIDNIILPALEIMKENKNFKFEMEQTLNLMEFLEAYPNRKNELIDLYKAGRLELFSFFFFRSNSEKL